MFIVYFPFFTPFHLLPLYATLLLLVLDIFLVCVALRTIPLASHVYKTASGTTSSPDQKCPQNSPLLSLSASQDHTSLLSLLSPFHRVILYLVALFDRTHIEPYCVAVSVC